MPETAAGTMDPEDGEVPYVFVQVGSLSPSARATAPLLQPVLRLGVDGGDLADELVGRAELAGGARPHRPGLLATPGRTVVAIEPPEVAVDPEAVPGQAAQVVHRCDPVGHPAVDDGPGEDLREVP